MSVADISGKAIANLEVESLKHENPTFHGDTIYAETTVLDKRESSSKTGPRHHHRRDARIQSARRAGVHLQAARDGAQARSWRAAAGGHPGRRGLTWARGALRLAARYSVRPLLPGPADALREAVLRLGLPAEKLTVLARAWRGRGARASRSELGSDSGPRARSSPTGAARFSADADGDRAVLLMPLSTAGSLPHAACRLE